MVSALHRSHVGPYSCVVPADPAHPGWREGRFHFCTISNIFLPPDSHKLGSLSHKLPVALVPICVRALEISQHGSHCFLGQIEPERVSTS